MLAEAGEHTHSSFFSPFSNASMLQHYSCLTPCRPRLHLLRPPPSSPFCLCPCLFNLFKRALSRLVGTVFDADSAEAVVSMAFTPPPTQEGQAAVHERARDLIFELIKHNTGNFKSLIDLVAARADVLRRST